MILGFVLLLFVHGGFCENKDCQFGGYLEKGRCVSCFTNAFGRQRCRDMCTSAYPVKRCENTCRYYCIDEWCQTVTNSCIRGCAKGMYGTMCDRRCSIGCNNSQCDRDGDCKCKTGYFGRQCNVECPQNCDDKRCNQTNGKCSNGCKTYWYGERCDKKCSQSCNQSLCDFRNGKCLKGCTASWCGDKCDKNCYENCNNIQSQDGVCDGCKPGYRGSLCNISCPRNCIQCDQHVVEKCTECHRGKYGPFCRETCYNCVNGSCDIYGNCTEGCKLNYYAPKCDKLCSNSCETESRNASRCSQVSGACIYGCKQGWYGDHCERNCSNGCINENCDIDGNCTEGCKLNYYGPNCDKLCSTSCVAESRNASRCSQSNGTCIYGCKKGWYGDSCKRNCSKGCVYSLCNRKTGVCSEGCQNTSHGPFCNITCNSKCKGGVCNETTGACTEGCYGTSFGQHCNSTCSDRCSKSECQMSETAEVICTRGCVDGRWGRSCQHQCPENCKTCNNTFGTCGQQGKHGNSNSNNQVPPLWIILSGCLMPVIVIVSVAVYIFRRHGVNRRTQRDNAANQTSMMLTLADRADSLPLLRAETYVDKTSVTTKVPTDQFKKYVNKQKLTKGLVKQFYRLPVNPVYPCYEGDLSRSAVKNRYGNILPYDYNRIVLAKDSTGLSSDYINASNIEGYTNDTSFIATQGPYTEVMAEFWHMIWQKDVYKIVMLTNCVENKKKKCEQYWPKTGQAQMITPNLIVECRNESVGADVTIRTFSVEKEGEEVREIKQFHFTSWPDHDVPDDRTSLLNFHTVVTKDVLAGPTVVHCSAGVGRTGTYIALDYLIEQAKKEGVVDVFECVLRLRHQRMNLVQTEEQYLLLHDVLLQAVESMKHSRVTVNTHTGEEEI